MNKIILPIKNKYSQAILNGTKKFEIRRKIPKNKINKVIIYETSPTSKIVGAFNVIYTHWLKINELWELTKNKNSLTKQELKSYLKNQNYGYAFEIGKKIKFKTPKNIEEYNLKYAPQGFVYIK